MKIILIDIGGVIFKTKGIEYAFMRFIGEDDTKNQISKAKLCKKEFIKLINGDINEEQFYNTISSISRKKIEDCKKITDFIDYHINSDIIYKLVSMHSKYKLGIISDTNSIIYELVKNSIDKFDEIFEKELIFLSYIEKDSKYIGEKKYFEKIIKKILIEPNEIVFIDDEWKNIQNAKKCGIKTIHYEKNNDEYYENKRIIDLIKKM